MHGSKHTHTHTSTMSTMCSHLWATREGQKRGTSTGVCVCQWLCESIHVSRTYVPSYLFFFFAAPININILCGYSVA